MTLVIPTWFIILWAVALIFGMITSVVSTKKFDKMAETIATRATQKIEKVFEEAANKTEENNNKCLNTLKKGSPSQKSQKK